MGTVNSLEGQTDRVESSRTALEKLRKGPYITLIAPSQAWDIQNWVRYPEGIARPLSLPGAFVWHGDDRHGSDAIGGRFRRVTQVSGEEVMVFSPDIRGNVDPDIEYEIDTASIDDGTVQLMVVDESQP